jgi:glucokinase
MPHDTRQRWDRDQDLLFGARVPYALGIDLGGSSVKGLAVTRRGRLLREMTLGFDPAQRGAWAEAVCELADRIAAAQHHAPAWIGAAAPGLAAKDERSIAYLPGRLDGLPGTRWDRMLKVRQAVPVLNDAHAALLGEVWHGAARGCPNVVMLTLGTGVGGAALVDGNLLRGHTGKAGHLGHICLDPAGPDDIIGTPGSLELAIGNCTVRERTRGRFGTTHNLIAAHRSGDAEATRVWLESVRALGAAVVSFANVLDPEVVVIGGGIARAGKELFGPLRQFVAAHEWRTCGHRVRIVPAKLGEYAGAYGAAFRGLRTPHTA